MTRIDVKGAIVPDEDSWIYDLFGMPNASPSKVRSALDEAAGGDNVADVYINSGGGDVFSGSEIYSALRAFKGRLTIHVTGVAASAASVVAMAGKCLMAPTAQMMVHNVSTYADGNYHDMDHASDALQTADRAIAAAYVAKSGMSETDALDLMDRETWLTANDALEYGLIDGIEENQNLALVNGMTGTLLPANVLAKCKAEQQALIDYFTKE